MIRRKTRSARRQGLLEDRKVRQQLERAVADFARDEIKPKFHAVVSDWKTPVNFKIDAAVKPDEIRVAVVPFGQNKKIFEYVDLGTRPHKIRPKQHFVRNKKAALAFVTGGPGSYQPRTRPVAQAGVGPGKVQGGSLIFAQEVNHPGTEARRFSEAIEADVTPAFQQYMDNVFRRIRTAE